MSVLAYSTQHATGSEEVWLRCLPSKIIAVASDRYAFVKLIVRRHLVNTTFHLLMRFLFADSLLLL